ncbi:hypothetical protein AV530_005676 [Patagioenas fasciata monilis]|uniref:Uncharacterized protein n=1 Tax=Patagioenas fasciata monilis TaxID=372326 RepID=A0A1V4JM67_PATFA|nr:hypothetical protein AV530_005676 [Patagioenas fasciata monilis]
MKTDLPHPGPFSGVYTASPEDSTPCCFQAWPLWNCFDTHVHRALQNAFHHGSILGQCAILWYTNLQLQSAQGKTKAGIPIVPSQRLPCKTHL